MSDPILCPDCKCLAYGHFYWVVGGEGGCNTDGCKCTNTPQQAIEKWIAQDRASVRRAALLEACNTVCPGCADNDPLAESALRIHVRRGREYACRAWGLHLLLAQSQQEQAQGEGGEG